MFSRPAEIRRDAFCAFVSHRWLDPHNPDPDNMQCRLLCCQIFAALLDAIQVACRRGLDAPRRFSGGFAIGPHGSELAESMIVNLLRPHISAVELARLREEASNLNEYAANGGTDAAKSDAALLELSRLLVDRPLLQDLVGRILVWYDYSCIPVPVVKLNPGILVMQSAQD
jgi:hypothetical protein